MYRNNVLRKIVQLKVMFEEPLQFESMNSHTVSTLINVPQFNINEDFYLGLEALLSYLFESGGGPDLVIPLVLRLVQRHYNTELHAELNRNKLMPKVLDQFEVVTLMICSDIELSHWRRVV
jgi:hypothetical protein